MCISVCMNVCPGQVAKYILLDWRLESIGVDNSKFHNSLTKIIG